MAVYSPLVEVMMDWAAGLSDGRLDVRPAFGLQVLALLGRGSRVAEAAKHLGLTDQTVATYVKTIYRKLRITSRAEAAIAAQKRGLI